ncbi:MAG: hypothetical protein QOG76_2526, partial [Pseudonocardiales bacterium]|nr:hypothetical protein [Pseudonocardiales bacterium]
DVVVAGMSATAQWVKPLPVDASGSYMDTTKLCAVTGAVTGAPAPELVPHAANTATSNPAVAIQIEREDFISTPAQ